MSYEEKLADARARRVQADERRRAEKQVDGEEQAAQRRRTGETILRIATGGITSRSFGETTLRAPADPASKKKAPDKSRPDPDGDPLAALTAGERDALDKDPELKKHFLAKVEAAEASRRAELERQKNLDEAWAAHDARGKADALADRVIGDRAKARGQ